MLTPIEIQDKNFKSGIGYDKKDVDAFLKDILTNYEMLYTKNAELEDKVAVLSEGLSHYKSNEKSIQKALVLAQNVADEIIATANKKAQAIEEKAYAKSDEILLNSKVELNRLNAKVADLSMKFETYKNSCKHFAMAQLEMLENSVLMPAEIAVEPVVAVKPVRKAKTETQAQQNVMNEAVNTESDNSVEAVDTKAPDNKPDSDINEVEDFTVNIDLNDFEFEQTATEEVEDLENIYEQESIQLINDTPVVEENIKPALADEFNIGINFSENSKYVPNDSIRYYEEQLSEKEDKIVKESGFDESDDEFIFDDIDEDAGSIGIDFDFLNTKK